MNAQEWLSVLYYDIGKQMTYDMRTSYSKRLQNGGVIYHKWCKVIEMIGTNTVFSHRTILMNEIVVDIETRKYPIIQLKLVCYDLGLPYYIIDTTSKGYHIHLFDDKMFKMTKQEREDYREEICDKFKLEYDKQLLSENHMISFELTPHWKTNNVPILIKTNIEKVKIW